MDLHIFPGACMRVLVSGANFQYSKVPGIHTEHLLSWPPVSLDLLPFLRSVKKELGL